MSAEMREVVARWLHPTASGMRMPSPLPEVLPTYALPDWREEAWKHFEGVSAELDAEVETGFVTIDPEEFEAAILATRDDFLRANRYPTTHGLVIDLPNWVRGTILEQIAFTNGFTIADRRDEE